MILFIMYPTQCLQFATIRPAIWL